MITKVSKTLKQNNVKRGDCILVALSGGMDSSVLLDVLCRLREEFGISVVAAHLNHMLRGDAANSDENFAREKCKAYQVPFISERVDVAEAAKKRGESEELAARNIRYDFLYRAKKELGADFIATAHNANDNLETMLFNLSRGSGIDGMGGIPPVRGEIIRPLIECSRAEIEEYAKTFEVPFCVDGTNAELLYSRNKIRHNVVAPLTDINPKTIENASRTASILRIEAEFLKKSAEQYAKKISRDGVSCVAAELLAEPALISRVCEIFISRALGEENYSLEFCHTEQIIRLAKSPSPSDRISLPRGAVVKRRYDEIVFEKAEETEVLPVLSLKEGESMWGDYTVSVKKTEKNEKVNSLFNTFFVPCDRIQGSLVIRGRKLGDEIKLSGRKTKTLKRLFIDEKLPRDERGKVPVIADDEKVFGVLGFGSDCRFVGEDSGYLIKINKK